MIKQSNLIRLHRRIGWMAALAFLLWAFSGILHPVMTWTNPRPVAFTPPAIENALPFDVLKLLQKNRIEDITALRVIGDKLQITTGQTRTVIDSRTGKIIPDADKDRAIFLARHYTGLKDESVKSVTPIYEFNDEYPYINRYLPVWKVTFERNDGLSVWVDTGEDRLGSITNHRKEILQSLFQNLHTAKFLDGIEPLRLTYIALAVGSIFFMTLAGFLMLMGRKGSLVGTRRWHRTLAYIVTIPIFMFTISGTFHLFMQSPVLDKTPDYTASHTSRTALKYPPEGNNPKLITLADNESWWRVETKGAGASYKNATNGNMLTEDYFVRHIANVDEKQPVQKITGFTDEYGFAFKRLPVYRVENINAVIFIEPQTGIIAARVSKMNVAEQWSFSNLHKWQFLNFIGRVQRDIVQISFILLAFITAMMGIRLLVKRKGKGV